MIRKFGITLITLMILWSGAAFGALEAVEEAAEVSVSGIRLPAGSAGNVVYRKCAGCDPLVWPVNTSTTYYIGFDTAPVPLSDLRQAVKSDRYELIYVFYTPDSGVVTRVVLDPNTSTEG